MKKLSMIMMLAFVCGSFAMAQTSNVAKKATLMPDGAVITNIKTGEVIRTTKGTVALPGTISASLTVNGAPAGSGTTSKQTSTGNIAIPTLNGLTTSSSTNSGGVQTIQTPGGSVTGNGGSSLINSTNQGPIGPGSGATQKDVDLTAPIPVNTNNQVSPQ